MYEVLIESTLFLVCSKYIPPHYHSLMIVNKIDFLYALQYALISRPNQHWLKIRIRHAVMVENIQQGNDCFDLRTHLLEASCFQFR